MPSWRWLSWNWCSKPPTTNRPRKVPMKRPKHWIAELARWSSWQPMLNPLRFYCIFLCCVKTRMFPMFLFQGTDIQVMMLNNAPRAVLVHSFALKYSFCSFQFFTVKLLWGVLVVFLVLLSPVLLPPTKHLNSRALLKAWNWRLNIYWCKYQVPGFLVRRFRQLASCVILLLCNSGISKQWITGYEIMRYGAQWLRRLTKWNWMSISTGWTTVRY